MSTLVRRAIFLSVFTIGAFGSGVFAGNKLHLTNDRGEALSGATVEFLIPSRPERLTTDTNGDVDKPEAWAQPTDIKIAATGAVTSVFYAQVPSVDSLVVSQADLATPVEFAGKTTEYGRLRQDGLVDFSIVLPGLRPDQLTTFDPSWIMSPEVDQIRIVGHTIDIPSNISLPKQEESYIFTITIDKPQYRTYLKQSGPANIVAVHGQFPLEEVVDQLRDGQSLFSLFDYFSFSTGGSLPATGMQNQANQTIAINQFNLTDKVSVRAPSAPTGTTLLAVILNAKDGYYFPSDIKQLVPRQAKSLAALPSVDRYILTIARPTGSLNIHAAEFRERFASPIPQAFSLLGEFLGADQPVETNFAPMSLTIDKAGVADTSTALELIDPPKVVGTDLKFDVPQLPADVQDVATKISLAEVQFLPRGNLMMEKKFRLWESQTPGWISQLAIPKELSNLPRNKTYRWEVVYYGKARNNPVLPITHTSRNKLDIKL